MGWAPLLLHWQRPASLVGVRVPLLLSRIEHLQASGPLESGPLESGPLSLEQSP